MNPIPRYVRFVAAVASIVITGTLLSGVFALAEPPAASALLARAAPAVIVR